MSSIDREILGKGEVAEGDRFQVIEEFDDDPPGAVEKRKREIKAELAAKHGIPEEALSGKIIFVIIRTFCKRPKGEVIIPPPGEGEE